MCLRLHEVFGSVALARGLWEFGGLGLKAFIVEARKLEHHSLHALKVNYTGS